MTPKKQRYTCKRLMEAIHQLVVENGCYEKAEKIIDYFLADCYDSKRVFTSYKFDVLATPNFGGCEGIYLDIAAVGIVDGSGTRETWHLGTYKTLSTSLEAAQIMGELGGSIMYWASSYINKNLEAFEPDAKK